MHRLAPIFLLVALLAVPARAQEAWPAADPADVATIETVLAATYDAISGPAGPRDWDRFRSLFRPEARLQPIGRVDSTYAVRTMSVDDYVARAGGWFDQNPFFERELARRVESYGPLAHVFSTYGSYRGADDAAPFDRGINSFQLMHDGSRWWVVSILWFAESGGVAIPDSYLPQQ